MRLRNKKTGEIIEGKCFTDIVKKLHDRGDPICSGPLLSIALFEQYWKEIDEYKPAEPLIKDERIRKVVRLCANIWETEKLLVTKLGSIIDFSDGYVRHMDFSYAEWQDEIEDRTYYTIEELCGEEKE